MGTAARISAVVLLVVFAIAPAMAQRPDGHSRNKENKARAIKNHLDDWLRGDFTQLRTGLRRRLRSDVPGIVLVACGRAGTAPTPKTASSEADAQRNHSAIQRERTKADCLTNVTGHAKTGATNL